MALVIENCLKLVPNKFELVLLACYRTKMLVNGSSPLYEPKTDDEKSTIISLTEISDNLLDVSGMHELVKGEIKNRYFMLSDDEFDTKDSSGGGMELSDEFDNNDADESFENEVEDIADGDIMDVE